jgi:hydroxylaminobenzene mutase
VLALLVGATTRLFTNPRMALSAHQQGVAAGTLLMLFGLAWSHARFSLRVSHLAARLVIVGAYALWCGSSLAASFGTGRATPIAGAGFRGEPWQELTVAVILLIGSLASLAGVGSLLMGLIRGARTDPAP